MYNCICKRCGKGFESSYPTSCICPDCKVGKCVICGKEFKRTGSNPEREVCSLKCSVELKRLNGTYDTVVEKCKKTNLERYGVENAFQSDEIKKKIRQTNLERYGVEHPQQLDEIKEKTRQTNLERYGVEYPAQNEESKEKYHQTMLEKYGVEIPIQNEEIKKKYRQTMLEKYGVEIPIQNEEIKKKYRQTNLERYGVEYFTQTEEFKEKTRQTNLEKYGVENPSQSPEIVGKIKDSLFKYHYNLIEDLEQRKNYKLFYEDPKAYLEKFEKKPTYMELCQKLGVNSSSIGDHIVKSNLDCEEFVQMNHSSFENEVFDFLKYVDKNIKITRNNRHVINPQEIDLYLPDYKLGIECNSTYIHNSSLPSYNVHEPKSEGYHQKKSLACEEKGVFLFHLFEWEWNQKRSIIQSMLKNILGKCDEKYYARKLKVVELTQQICADFLNENHRQGSINSPVRLGLTTKDTDELISVMTFGKMRSGIGKRNDDDEETWELSRFCSKLNTVVVGGASKLFKFFIDHFEPQKIVSFSDMAHTKGNLYQTLGFKKISITDPGYCYLHINTDLMLSREQCQKQNLRKLFQDETIDIENKTEPQIMLEHGFVRMYDSGSIRWEWTC